MRRSLLVLLVGPVSLLTSMQLAVADTSVVTDPVGFTTTSLLGNSDTYISTPFTRVPEFIGATSVAASANSLTVAGTPWTTNQFVYGGAQHNHYYVLIGPCNVNPPREGHTFAVTANTSNTLTVFTSADDLTGIAANTQITIIPNWTPATLFPASDATVSFTPTTSPPTYKTTLRIPNHSAAGINLAYAAEYYFNTVWRRTDNNADASDDPLIPDGYLVVRNANGAPTLPLTNLGSVLMKKLAVPLMTQPAQQQDNPVSILRPLDVALNASGLNPGDGSFGANDQLLLFNNAQAGLDKAPFATYIYSGGWRLSGDNVTDHGADVIPMGTGFIIRKAATGSPQTFFWTNAFPVQAVAAVSRKYHGGSALFDVPLPLNVAPNGLPGIECRGPGQTNAGPTVDYQVVFTFPVNVSFTGAVSSPPGLVDTANGNNTLNPTVNLKGVANAQKVTITLQNVSNGTNTNDVAVEMGILIGDVNGSGVVTSGDTNLCKGQALQGLTVNNFRDDVNASGVITSGDANIIKQNALAHL
jgi:uncharacterized protein (TIGR02597 family)